jgi:hypothetical protein
MAKFVRAKRTGFWDGQRRRNGAVFPVADNADENWFEAVGPAPAGTELPAQLLTAQAPPPRGFVQVMADLAKAEQAQRPKTLSEASSAVDDGASDLT